MTICSKCKTEFEREKRNGYCRDCHAAYMREHRPKYSELSDDQRKRANCRSYSNVLQKRGILQQEPCADCGSHDSEKHHENYDDPRTVEWLCRDCHLNRHLPEKS